MDKMIYKMSHENVGSIFRCILNTTKIYPLTKNIIHTHIHAILAKDVYICTKIESQGQS